jgi:hypothetical protein
LGLFVLASSSQNERVLPEMAMFGGTVFRTSLSEEQQNALEEALSVKPAWECRCRLWRRGFLPTVATSGRSGARSRLEDPGRAGNGDHVGYCVVTGVFPVAAVRSGATVVEGASWPRS